MCKEQGKVGTEEFGSLPAYPPVAHSQLAGLSLDPKVLLGLLDLYIERKLIHSDE